MTNLFIVLSVPLKGTERFEPIYMHVSADSHTSTLLTRVWNYTSEQVQVLMEGAKHELIDRNLTLITSYRFVRGRMPAGPRLIFHNGSRR